VSSMPAPSTWLRSCLDLWPTVRDLVDAPPSTLFGIPPSNCYSLLRAPPLRRIVVAERHTPFGLGPHDERQAAAAIVQGGSAWKIRRFEEAGKPTVDEWYTIEPGRLDETLIDESDIPPRVAARLKAAL
jgi:hypothetical protein